MVIKPTRGLYNKEHHMNIRHSSRSSMPSFNAQLYNSNLLRECNNFDDMDVDNAFLDIQRECSYWESDLTNTDDGEFRLSNGSGDMWDTASFNSKYDYIMEDCREGRYNSMLSRYGDMMAYRRWRELDDIMMNDIRKQVSINSLSKSDIRHPLSSGPVMLLNGDLHSGTSNQFPPKIDVNVSSGFKNTRSISFSKRTNESLKRRWCSGRAKSRSAKMPSLLMPAKDHQFYNHPLEELFNHHEEGNLTALPEEIVIKVRNVHPTACLHELHVQRRKLFPKKPTFKTSKYVETQNRGSFSVVCNFEFNGASLWTQHTEQTKSDARLKAARNMLRKLKSITNLTIVLDDEKTSFEHPRCRLLHLHDENPTLYPESPTFQATVCGTASRSRGKSRYINMVCHFQVGKEKLAAFGVAHSKKQAIVQAARNMLKRLFPLGENGKESQGWSEQPLSEKMNTPWKCHFCKIFMTGRKPFLSHLTGRSHVQKMSELQLNVEEENKKLVSVAEEEFEKKEDAKRETALENCLQGLTKELERNKNDDFLSQSDKIFYKNSSSQESQESEMSKSSSSNSEKSEFEVSCSRSSSSLYMKAIE